MDSTSNSPKERTATTPPLQPDQKHKKACEACRSLKVRCLPDPSPAATKCQRCTRFNRVCIFGVSARRRPRKRTDTRVKELEQELRAVRSLLRHDSASGPASSVGGPTVQTASDSGHDGLSPQHISAHSDSPETGSLTGSMDDRDIIQKGWLSIELATELFQLYNRELMPCYPIVVFHPDTTVDDVRTQTPTLFLVIMGSAAGKDHPQLCRLLNREFLRVYADMVIINSKKSLELVQCMLLSAVWYYPPDRFEDLKYYQYIHMAASMALELGLGEPPITRTTKDSTSLGVITSTFDYGPQATKGRIDTTAIECQRILVACYLTCSSVAISQRRPCMFQFTTHVEKSIHFIETSPEAAPSDKSLAAWVRLQHIVEQASNSLGLYDPSTSKTLADLDVQLALKKFELQMVEWNAQHPLHAVNPCLAIQYHQSHIYLHEIALHEDHHSSEFRPPFVIRTRPSNSDSKNTELTPTYVRTVLNCVSSAQASLETLLATEIPQARAVPVFTFARAAYALVILIKVSLTSMVPSCRLSKILDAQTTKPDDYLDRMVAFMEKCSNGGRCRVPTKFGGIMAKLRDWYQSQVKPDKNNISDDWSINLIPPLTALKVATDKDEVDCVQFYNSTPIPVLTDAQTSTTVLDKGQSETIPFMNVAPVLPQQADQIWDPPFTIGPNTMEWSQQPLGLEEANPFGLKTMGLDQVGLPPDFWFFGREEMNVSMGGTGEEEEEWSDEEEWTSESHGVRT